MLNQCLAVACCLFVLLLKKCQVVHVLQMKQAEHCMSPATVTASAYVKGHIATQLRRRVQNEIVYCLWRRACIACAAYRLNKYEQFHLQLCTASIENVSVVSVSMLHCNHAFTQAKAPGLLLLLLSLSTATTSSTRYCSCPLCEGRQLLNGVASVCTWLQYTVLLYQ
jgi:hypothetical protein